MTFFFGKFLLHAIKTGKVVTKQLNSNFLFLGNYPKMYWEKVLTDQQSVTVFLNVTIGALSDLKESFQYERNNA